VSEPLDKCALRLWLVRRPAHGLVCPACRAVIKHSESRPLTPRPDEVSRWHRVIRCPCRRVFRVLRAVTRAGAAHGWDFVDLDIEEESP
jgi:hypothetical protein